MKAAVNLEVEAPDGYNLGRLAAAVGLAFSDSEAAQDLTLLRIDVEDMEKFRD